MTESSISDGEATDELIPDYPNAADTEWATCEATGDFVPIMFDWYRWVGNCCTVVAFIQPNSSSFAKIPPIEYYLLSGLLMRCSKLMLSIIALTHKGEFGEAASIIHRSLTETATKLIWLCKKDQADRAKRMIAEGLRTELEFEKEINRNIKAAKTSATPLEKRMLSSIEHTFVASGMIRADIIGTKKLPDMASMMNMLGWPRMQYVVQQRIGSHAVHGTWANLLIDYLTKSDIDGFEFMPNGEHVKMHINQYMFGARQVLLATAAYVQYCLVPPDCDELIARTEEAHKHLMADYLRAVGKMDKIS